MTKAACSTFAVASLIAVGALVPGCAAEAFPAMDAGQSRFLAKAASTPVMSKSRSLMEAVATPATGNEWVEVGSLANDLHAEGLSFSRSGPHQWIALDGHSRPSVVFVNNSDVLYYKSATVVSYNGVSWEVVGKPGFATATRDCAIAIDPISGTLYVVAEDEEQKRTNVWIFQDGKWKIVGQFSFSFAWSQTQIVVVSGAPYVISQNASQYSTEYFVMRFNSTSNTWITVGDSPFFNGQAQQMVLAVSTSTPYVAFTRADSAMVYVMGHVNGEWHTLGTKAYVPETDHSLGLAMVVNPTNGFPILAYSSAYWGFKVVAYDGSNWNVLGDPNVLAQQPSLAVTSSGKLVMGCYVNDGGYEKVLMWDHSRWTPLGSSDGEIPAQFRQWMSLAIDTAGKSYLAYQAKGTGNIIVAKLG